jgi:hypothetical protein
MSELATFVSKNRGFPGVVVVKESDGAETIINVSEASQTVKGSIRAVVNDRYPSLTLEENHNGTPGMWRIAVA